MRNGRSSRADAITNSPFVRALIKPVRSIIPALTPLPIVPPAPSDLISTQPSVASTSTLTVNPIAVEDTERSQKRARTYAEEQEEEVQTNYTEETLPPDLVKYWAQRYRLFSLFDEGIHMDREGWYSVTPESIAQQIAERCRCNTIVDAFCGVGGNAIQFAFTCERVIAIDISATRLACARKNAEIYGVADRIEFIQADFVEWARERARKKGQQEADEIEVVFLSPPWGGIEYQTLGTGTPTPITNGHVETGDGGKRRKKKQRKSVGGDEAGPASVTYPLSALAPLSGQELFALSTALTPHVAMYLPRNVDLLEVAQLARRPDGTYEDIELEEEWMGWKMKAVTAYFGDLKAKLS